MQQYFNDNSIENRRKVFSNKYSNVITSNNAKRFVKCYKTKRQSF